MTTTNFNFTVTHEAIRKAVDEAVNETLAELLPDLVAREVAKLNHPSNGESAEAEPYVFKKGDRVQLEADKPRWTDGSPSFAAGVVRGSRGVILDSDVEEDPDVYVAWDNERKGYVNPNLLSLVVPEPVDPKAGLEVGKTYLVGPDPQWFDSDGQLRESVSVDSGNRVTLTKLAPTNANCDQRNVVVNEWSLFDPTRLLSIPAPEPETNDEAKWGLEVGGTYVLGPNPGFISPSDVHIRGAWKEISEGKEVVLRDLYLGGAKGTFEANVTTESGLYVDPADLIRPETFLIHEDDYTALPAYGPDRWIADDIVFPLVGDEFYQVKQASVEKLGEFKPSNRKPKVGDRIRLLVEHPNRQYPAAPAGVTATVRAVDDLWYDGKFSIEHDLVDGREAPYYGANLLARDEFTILVTS